MNEVGGLRTVGPSTVRPGGGLGDGHVEFVKLQNSLGQFSLRLRPPPPGIGGGVVVEESLIKVLCRFHQNNDVSMSEIAHTSSPIPPPRSPASNQEGIMALQPHTVECIFGTVLAMALIIAATAWAFPLYSISGAGSEAVGFFNLPLIF